MVRRVRSLQDLLQGGGGFAPPEMTQPNYAGGTPMASGPYGPPEMLGPPEAPERYGPMAPPGMTQESAVPAERMNMTSPAQRVDEATGQPLPSGNQEIIQQYLQGLQEPVDMPQRPGLTKNQIWSIILNPQHSQMLMQHYGAPHEQAMQEWQMNQGRQGQAAGLAGQLQQQELEQQRYGREQTRESEQIRANAGDVNYQYTNPEFAAAAQQRNKYNEARIAQMGRSGMGKQELPQTQQEYLGDLEEDLRAISSKILQPDITTGFLGQDQENYPQHAAASQTFDMMDDMNQRKQAELAMVQMMGKEEWERWRATPYPQREEELMYFMNMMFPAEPGE